jgi:hypothetical protein
MFNDKGKVNNGGARINVLRFFGKIWHEKGGFSLK